MNRSAIISVEVLDAFSFLLQELHQLPQSVSFPGSIVPFPS